MTDIAYEKGYGLLRLLESKVGRERFDAFLRDYFDRFAFYKINRRRIYMDNCIGAARFDEGMRA